MLRFVRLLLVAVVLMTLAAKPWSVNSQSAVSYLVHPGDTWAALAFRAGVDPDQFVREQKIINPHRQPVIGSTISLHETPYTTGRLLRIRAGGLLESAVRTGGSPWGMSLNIERPHPFLPPLFDLLHIAHATTIPRELPVGFASLSLSELVARPGQAVALQGILDGAEASLVTLGGDAWLAHRNEDRLIAIGAIHAFFGDGTPDLRIASKGAPAWEQPLLVMDKEWSYDRVNFPASATFDPEELEQERERLRTIWNQVTPALLWSSTYSLPIQEYVALTSDFGARRSVNGGPFDTYHEGTDFSAYRGTEVIAPARGEVVLAETLQVRGGAVIIDHGLGIHSGYYHLSKVRVAKGDRVEQGSVLGEVGSTGRSTGNHLHWDLLIGAAWVDPLHWVESNLGARIRVWWGTPAVQTHAPHVSRNPEAEVIERSRARALP